MQFSNKPSREEDLPGAKVYNEATGLPQKYAAVPQCRLQYSRHAQEESLSDRYGRAGLPERVPAGYRVVEAVVVGEEVLKQVVRGRLDQERDLVLVVLPRTGRVKTVWINLCSDNHATLKTWRLTRHLP